MSWPRILAFILLMAGILSYIRNYPFTKDSPGSKSMIEDDSLISALTRLPVVKTTGPKLDTLSIRNPFLAQSHPVSGTANHRLEHSSPVRRWTLKGTAGNSVATLVDSVGVKHLMRVGDTVGGVRVLEVHPSHVSMQDEAGRFELGLDK